MLAQFSKALYLAERNEWTRLATMHSHRKQGYREVMRVEISPEAAAFVQAHGGTLWVWAARPKVCCASAPAYMHAAAQPPQEEVPGFRRVPVAGLELWFRAPGGPLPRTLEIALWGKRHPRLEAYWDGCLFALNG